MDKTDFSESNGNQLNNLCRRVEETAGIKASTPLQFEALSETILRHTGKLLSPTTLKRIWGYLNEPTNPRISTLNALARFCGWRDYEDFVAGNVPEIESGPLGSNVIKVERDMKKGERIRLMWQPSRVCVIEYLGQWRWRVVESTGTRLLAGDTFSCQVIANGEPLYASNLTHDGTDAGVYVCGRKSGITFVRLS